MVLKTPKMALNFYEMDLWLSSLAIKDELNDELGCIQSMFL